MLPRVWWVDLETLEQRQAALTWDGSYVVRTLGGFRPFGPPVDLCESSPGSFTLLHVPGNKHSDLVPYIYD